MKKLESVKSTKFEKLESKKLSLSQTQNVKGGDAYCTGAGFHNYYQKDYKGDCCDADGKMSYDFYETLD